MQKLKEFCKTENFDLLTSIPHDIIDELKSKSVKLLERAVEVLESIDKSIDFLAAAMTGMDPLEIEMGQVALGRLARPKSRHPAAAREQESEIDEKCDAVLTTDPDLYDLIKKLIILQNTPIRHFMKK